MKKIFRIYALLLLLAFVNNSVLSAENVKMRRFLIDLPPYRVAFSIPEEIALQISPKRIVSRFDISTLSERKQEYAIVASFDYFFNGPFWSSYYGQLSFGVSIHKRSSALGSSVATARALEEYIRGRLNSTSLSVNTKLLDVKIGNLNGNDCVRRGYDNTSDQKVLDSTSVEVFSLPLDEDHFLEIGFNIEPGSAGRTRLGKWKPRAEELKGLIRDSIRLEH